MLPGNDGSDFSLAYALARVGFGINLFAHGLSRISAIASFAESLRNTFAKTWLPELLVTAAGLAIPPIELTIGILITLGLLLRPALIAGMLLMWLLNFRQLPAPTMVRRLGAANLHRILCRADRLPAIQSFLARYIAQAFDAAQLSAAFIFFAIEPCKPIAALQE